MPWDALLTRSTATDSADRISKLQTMVLGWSSAVPDELAHLRINAIVLPTNPNPWHSWDVVREARASLPASLDEKLFKNEKRLKEELKRLMKQPAEDRKDITVGITPDGRPDENEAKLQALRTAVEQTTHTKTTAVRCANYESTLRGVASGEIDFALVSPYSTELLREAMNGSSESPESPENVILLGQTRKDRNPPDGYRVFLIGSGELADFPERINEEDVTLEYASQSSTSGYLIPLVMLNGMGVNLNRLQISGAEQGNHEKVIDGLETAAGQRLVAGVPSDRIEPRFERAMRYSWGGAIAGGAVGILTCGWIHRLVRRKRSTVPHVEVTSEAQ